MPSFVCKYCQTPWPTSEQLNRHQSKRSRCSQKKHADLRRLFPSYAPFTTQSAATQAALETTPSLSGQNFDVPEPFDGTESFEPDIDIDNTGILPINNQIPRRGVTIEDVPDEEVWIEIFPSEKEAGKTFGKGTTAFQRIRDEQVLRGEEIYGPFENEAEWELAKWLIKNVGHNAIEEFLNLPIIQERVKPNFTTKDELLEDIDTLPGGVNWKCQTVRLEGDRTDEDGKQMTEELELWMRDPHYADREGGQEQIDEMWTAEWWWELQKALPAGATAAPIILSSDKTKLSMFRGDKSAWPVYMTIGNISKDIRRKVHAHATILIGYLPVGKFECYKDKTRSGAQYRTFHKCMSLLTESLIKAGTEGVNMTCADGFLRWVFPILAAYVADYPEQCLVACCMENRCPICKVDPKQRGSNVASGLRTPSEFLRLLKNWQLDHDDEEFIKYGLRDIPDPFWAKLPYSNIFQAFTPDLLHQLHKGVFKDHLVKWCTAIVGEEELDARFKSMTSHPDLRHFKNGISFVSQWTGAEHKAMQRIFVGLLAGAVPNDAMICVRAAIDFIYYSSLRSHTNKTLTALSDALNTFHQHKDIFIQLGAREATHFNIPKIHSMQHYPALIRHFGSTDGFNTESPERLHIDYAKNAYRASNKKDYTIQMTRWLRRQESVDRFVVYLSWCKHGVYQEEGRATRVEYIHRTHGPVLSLPASSSSLIRYDIASNPSLSHVPASHIIIQHRTGHFLEALESYLQANGCRISPKPFDQFDLFKQITFTLPKIFPASDSQLSLKNIVRASSPAPARDRKKAVPGQMDFALISTEERNENTEGTPLEGLRVALVRVLFTLPFVFGVRTLHPLAYIEWYTPFGRPDPITSLITLKPSTRNHHAHGEVLSVTQIVRNCHLTPFYGRAINHSWNSENVVEKCRVFNFNTYSDLHTFSMLKCSTQMYRVS
ncbi:hypothetical protein V5O48_016604 [Marasmius crinis-equi]|uniref:C2H2-type domain-containing protein n=1 Tax=Marasmius crinis-equi TaxID=585013 RepID=A0ABR3ERB4_9AGAR